MSASPPKTLLDRVTRLFQSWKPKPSGTVCLDPEQEGSQSHPVQLKVICPDEDPKLIPLQGKGSEDIYLGRKSVCQIQVAVHSVSAVHARIRQRPSIWRRRFWHWLGWAPARFQLSDYDSTNGVYLGKRRVHQVDLRHGTALRLGPPRDPQSVKVEVIDPPSRLVYWARGVWLGIGSICLVSCSWIAQEWSRIPVDPLPSGTRGPLIVVAGDQHTQLKRVPGDTYRALPRLDDFGETLPQVVVAAEDHRFYSHWGVDLVGVLRAAVVNLRAGQVQQGGSSITQQLARTVLREYTGTENSLARKWREALAALKLENRYSKDEILVLYLNNVYLGNGLYGFESAARYYFGVSTQELDLSESATLAAILPAPNAFNPVDNYDAAIRGRDRVLSKLDQLDRMDEEEIERARRSRLTLNPELEAAQGTVAPYFYNMVIEEMSLLLGQELASEGNFIVETTLSAPLQRAAEQTIANTVAQLGPQYAFEQGALVTLDSRTGEILALVGGVDYQANQFNRAAQARRQPGSTFKIFTYTAAIEQGISIQQPYACSPLSWGGQTFKGCRSSQSFLSMAQGLILSENVIALRVAQQIGLPAMVRMAERMGIRSPIQPYPAVTLGTNEVTLVELTGAFGVLANQGIHSRPHAVRRILDSQDCADPKVLSSCREIYPDRESPIKHYQAIRGDVAATMTQLLQGVVDYGTGSSARIGRGEAGKTGTTTDNKDLLFVGYLSNPTWVTGIWLGNDDSSPTQGSSALAAQAWARFMTQAGV